MALICEICGSPIKTAPNRVRIDGAMLLVCQNCARRRAPQVAPPPKPISLVARPVRHQTFPEPELDVDPDYYLLVRRAREKMGLTQEALGRAINEKPSVISHVESKKIKPDPILARKLMHHLKINLLIPSSELETPG